MSDLDDDALYAALAGALGDCVVREAPPLDLAGCRLPLSLHPQSSEQLGDDLHSLSDVAARAVVQGAGSRPGLGNPARGARVRLCTRGLCGIDELDAADGVLRAAAGTPLCQLRSALIPHGWELPLDPPGAGGTLGGALASAASGPRRLAFGPVRDCVLGMDVALASGQHTRCGGRVVKNVTGYDLAKLYVGSLGTLGVIEAAWLRLRPRPQAVQVASGGLAHSPAAFALALEAARRPSARVVALVSRPIARNCVALRSRLAQEDAWLLVCELAGEEVTCEADADWLAGRAVAQPAGEDLVDAVRALENGPGALPDSAPDSGPGSGRGALAGGAAAAGESGSAGPGASAGGAGSTERLRVRLHLLPGAIGGACEQLARAGLALLVQPYPGLVHAYLDPAVSETRERVESALRAIERVRREAGGESVLEALPTWAHAGRDVFSHAEQVLPLMRALKARFDPAGLL